MMKLGTNRMQDNHFVPNFGVNGRGRLGQASLATSKAFFLAPSRS
jgi:hypothetical protein